MKYWNFKGRRAKFNQWAAFQPFFIEKKDNGVMFINIESLFSKRVLSLWKPKKDYSDFRVTDKWHREIPIEIVKGDIFFNPKNKTKFYAYWHNPKAKARPKNHKYGANNVYVEYNPRVQIKIDKSRCNKDADFEINLEESRLPKCLLTK